MLNICIIKLTLTRKKSVNFSARSLSLECALPHQLVCRLYIVLYIITLHCPNPVLLSVLKVKEKKLAARNIDRNAIPMFRALWWKKFENAPHIFEDEE